MQPNPSKRKTTNKNPKQKKLYRRRKLGRPIKSLLHRETTKSGDESLLKISIQGRYTNFITKSAIIRNSKMLPLHNQY